MAILRIAVEYDGIAGSDATGNDTLTTMTLGDVGGVTARGYFRFNLAAIAGATAVADVDLDTTNTANSGVDVGDTFAIHAYNGTGADDPELDSLATRYTRAVGGSALASSTGWNSISVKSTDLGTTADSQVLGNVSSPGFYSLGITPSTGVTANERISMAALEHASVTEPGLTVDYTPGGGGTTVQDIIGGFGIIPFAR